MLRKAKHSKRRGFHGTSNLMPHSSSQVHSTLVEPPLQPSLAPQSCVPSYSTAIPPSIPTAQNLVSASHPPLRSISRIFVFPILNQFWMFCFVSTQLHGHYGSIVAWCAVKCNWIYMHRLIFVWLLCALLYLHGTNFSFLFYLVSFRNA